MTETESNIIQGIVERAGKARSELAATLQVPAVWPEILPAAKALRDRNTTLLQSLNDALRAQQAIADQLDLLAQQSIDGGWSTHQVDTMRRLAYTLRRKVAKNPEWRPESSDLPNTG